MMAIRIAIIAVIFLFVAPLSYADNKKQDSDWKTVVRISTRSAKGSSLSLTVASIEEFTDSIIPAITGSMPKYLKCDNEGEWSIDTIGSWYEQTVIDLVYEVRCQHLLDTLRLFSLKAVKAIVVKVSVGEFRLLYISSTDPGDISYVQSELIKVKEYELLYTRSQRTGTGHDFDEAYWMWSEQLDVPRELQVEKADKEKLSGILPPEHGVWKGGHFDIKTLSFQSYTWRNGDGNCCPTGGKLSITYGIENDNLVVKRAIFDYSDLEERALWQALRSEDSMYLKNPPIIYERD